MSFVFRGVLRVKWGKLFFREWSLDRIFRHGSIKVGDLSRSSRFVWWVMFVQVFLFIFRYVQQGQLAENTSYRRSGESFTMNYTSFVQERHFGVLVCRFHVIVHFVDVPTNHVRVVPYGSVRSLTFRPRARSTSATGWISGFGE